MPGTSLVNPSRLLFATLALVGMLIVVSKGMTGRKVLLNSDCHMYQVLRPFAKLGWRVPHPIPNAFKRGGSLTGRWLAFAIGPEAEGPV